MKQTFIHTCHIERGRERETGRHGKREIYIGRERREKESNRKMREKDLRVMVCEAKTEGKCRP